MALIAKITAIMVLLLVFVSIAVLACNPLLPVSWSHVQANAPAQSEFDLTLKRDLDSYFQGRTGKNVSVEYEYLRQGPTQSGTSYPKYYLVKAATSMDSKMEM